jgi:indolepyruvate ferredoxin oxidoreductase
MERALIAEYREMVLTLMDQLTADNHATAVDLAALPEKVRGFGHVKEAAVATFRNDKARLLAQFAQQRAA